MAINEIYFYSNWLLLKLLLFLDCLFGFAFKRHRLLARGNDIHSQGSDSFGRPLKRRYSVRESLIFPSFFLFLSPFFYSNIFDFSIFSSFHCQFCVANLARVWWALLASMLCCPLPNQAAQVLFSNYFLKTWNMFLYLARETGIWYVNFL